MEFKFIIKAIEKEIEDNSERVVKHPVTERARGIGTTGKTGEAYIKDNIACFDRTYRDGTKITYALPGEAEDWMENDKLVVEDKYKTADQQVYSITTPEGNEIPFIASHQPYDERSIGYEGSNVEKGVPDEFDFISEAFAGNPTDSYGPLATYNTAEDGGLASSLPDAIRDVVINGKSVSKTKANFEGNDYENELLSSQDFTQDSLLDYALNEYNEAVKTNSFEGSNGFVTLETHRQLPSDEGVEKGIVTNKDYRYEEVTTYGFKMPDSWKVYTIREPDNPANCGVDLSKYAEPYYQEGPDSPGMFMTVPGQKTERLLIDEESKTIIQRPYKPGMDRKIWG